MKSYTTLRTTYGVDTKNTATANLSQGDEWMNDFHKRILAKADWPFLHRDRVISTYAPDSAFTAVAGTDICTATSSILTSTGTEVQFTSTTTLPAGLSENTTYYLIYQSTTTFKVASSLANALAGTAIDITDTGTGTHTVEVKSVFQPLPYDIDLVESVTIKIGDIIYPIKPCPSKNEWNKLQQISSESNIPDFWYVQDGKIAFYPKASTAGYSVTITGKLKIQDLNVADYTTGTVDIITNGSALVTGAGVTWTAPMVGKWIRVTHSNTAASSGDGQWYEIIAVPSSSTLLLARPYGGRSLTTGASAAYAIGQMPLLPEAFHDLPEHYGAFRYWLKEKDERKNDFKLLLDEGVSELSKAYGITDLSMVLDDGESDYLINPNLTIQL